MRHVIRSGAARVAMCLLAIVFASQLTACAPDEPATQGCLQGTSLGLVVPVHQNAQAPAVPSTWDCVLDEAVRAGVPISVVTAEGRPQVLVTSYVARLDAANSRALEDQVAAAKSSLVAAVAAAAAKSDGNDLLAAIGLVADLAPGGDIRVLDNGATDTGAVRTVDPGMSTIVDAADVVQHVAEAGACPSVAGSVVTFYGLGYQVAPAEQLSQRQRDRLGEIWTAVLVSCDARVSVTPLPRLGDGPAHQFSAAAIVPEEIGSMTVAPAVADDERCEAVVPEGRIGFVRDVATFLDDGAAREVVRDVAQRLSGCEGNVEVVGTTSSAGDEAGRARVSTARATAVRDLLAHELGLPAAQIEASGLGFDTSARGRCVEDRVDGVLDPVLAATNRKVIIRVAAR